jgi:hypothetical protein
MTDSTAEIQSGVTAGEAVVTGSSADKVTTTTTTTSGNNGGLTGTGGLNGFPGGGQPPTGPGGN